MPPLWAAAARRRVVRFLRGLDQRLPELVQVHPGRRRALAPQAIVATFCVQRRACRAGAAGVIVYVLPLDHRVDLAIEERRLRVVRPRYVLLVLMQHSDGRRCDGTATAPELARAPRPRTTTPRGLPSRPLHEGGGAGVVVTRRVLIFKASGVVGPEELPL